MRVRVHPGAYKWYLEAIRSTVLEIPPHHHATRFAARRHADVMESLSPEARALYDLLKADTREEYEAHFL
jgi:hypothetical protein